MEGVFALEFDLLSGRMTVSYEPNATDPDAIAEAVAKAGFTAVPWGPGGEAEPASFWGQHGRLLMACASGLLLAAGFLTHWALHGSLVDAISEGSRAHAFPLASVLLYAGAIVAGGWFVLPRAAKSAARLRPDMHLLMVAAVGGAMLIGQWFEAATVSFLFAVALMLEHWSVARARRAIGALMDLSPPTANVLEGEDGAAVTMPVAEVPVGSVVLVRPGEKVPLDGRVLSGESSVNQAPITGESAPVAKGPGDELFAGTINERGTLRFEVTRPADRTTLARIVHLVQEAQTRRAQSEQWVERFARHYTPAMMALAAGVAAVPPLLLGMDWATWLYRGLVLLVIACPCGLVISTPVSIVSALTSAMRRGVLVKGGMYLEMVGRLGAIAIDKTGTVTHGRPEVQEVIPLNGHTARELLERAAAVEADSIHPLADAIVRRAIAEGVTVRGGSEFRAMKGRGAEARIDGRLYWVGSHRLMEERGRETDESHRIALELEARGHSVVAVGSEGHVCGLISLADAVREGAATAIAGLRRLGLRKVVMLTGDNEGTARAVAEQAGVDEFRAGLLPQDKVEAVEALKEEASPVGMVGDGVNDAPALAAADVGIAMGAIGTAAAVETADIALMTDELSRLPWLVRHSRRTLRTIMQNVAFALAVKGAFLVLAVFGAATLWMAIAADTGASLLVIFNGLRLLGGEGAGTTPPAGLPHRPPGSGRS